MRIFYGVIISLLCIVFGLSLSYTTYATCSSTDVSISPATFISNCGAGTLGVDPGGGNQVTDITAYVINISKNLIRFGALFAIGAIVFSGIQYTTAYGEDEKVKKAKMTGIYALIGLVLLLTAFPLVDIIVNFIYGFH